MGFILSHTIIYRSKLSVNEALARIADAIEPKSITALDYWTKPGKYFKGKVYQNKFRLTYDARAGNIFNPVLKGVAEQTENGSVITVDFDLTKSDRILFYTIPLLTIIILICSFTIFESPAVFLLAIPLLLFLPINLLRFKWRCLSSTIYLEEAFKVKGEKQ